MAFQGRRVIERLFRRPWKAIVQNLFRDCSLDAQLHLSTSLAISCVCLRVLVQVLLEASQSRMHQTIEMMAAAGNERRSPQGLRKSSV